MNKKYEPLFTPFSINECEIKNRYIMCAMLTPVSCNKDGIFSRDTMEYYVERAKGGVGMITVSAHTVEDNVEKHAPGFTPTLVHDPHNYISEVGEMLDRIHAFDCKVFVQLTAGFGRVAHPLVIDGEGYISSSEVTNRWNGKPCRDISADEVKSIIQSFVKSAMIAQKAGYDGIQIHAVHEGYLLDQFAIAFFNKRDDEFGGSLENRLRFATEIVKAVKKACGDDFPVTMRFSIKSYLKALNQGGLPGEDFTEQGRDVEEALEAIKILEAAGYDAFDVDAGTYDSWYWAHPPMFFPKGLYLELAEQLKGTVTVPVIIAGRMDDPNMAVKALEDGTLDFVGLARPLLTDPDYVNKLAADRIEDIRPCMGCHDGCFTRKLEGRRGSCAVNPECARELMTGIVPANQKKKVMVIGGGPAGLEAARVSALRGHDVTLFEASESLGGNLKPAGGPDFKCDDEELVRWYGVQLKKQGVSVELNTNVNEELVKRFGADAVFMATGSSHVKLNLPGADREGVYTASEILLDSSKVQNSCLIVGGGLVGYELALMLAREGKKAVILEALDDILIAGAPLAPMNEWMLRDLINHHDITLMRKTRIKSITPAGAIVETRGEEIEIEGENIAFACGFRSRNALFDSIRFASDQVYNIGDSRRVQNIRGAVWSAYEIARYL